MNLKSVLASKEAICIWLLAVPETFIFTYGCTLAFALLLSPFINHFTFRMCNINCWCWLLLLNNDAAPRHDCAGCGSVPHKTQLLRDHLAHLRRSERRNTYSFSVLFIPLLCCGERRQEYTLDMSPVHHRTLTRVKLHLVSLNPEPDQHLSVCSESSVNTDWWNVLWDSGEFRRICTNEGDH